MWPSVPAGWSGILLPQGGSAAQAANVSTHSHFTEEGVITWEQYCNTSQEIQGIDLNG